MVKNPLVSLIITTKNEEQHLENLLKSILNQTYHSIEIIVVDNASKDKTQEIAKKYTSLVFSKGPERSAQRNYGAKKAGGSIFLFLDADMELGSHVVEDCVNVLRDPHFMAVVIPEESFGDGFWSSCKALERSFYHGVDWIESARVFRAAAFHNIGGFDERLSGPEDFDLPQRVKFTYGKNCIGRIQSIIRHNEGAIDLVELLKRKAYYGRSLQSYGREKHNKKFGKNQSSIMNRYRLFFSDPGKLFARPLVGLGMLFMKTSEFAALGFGAFFGNKK